MGKCRNAKAVRRKGGQQRAVATESRVSVGIGDGQRTTKRHPGPVQSANRPRVPSAEIPTAREAPLALHRWLHVEQKSVRQSRTRNARTEMGFESGPNYLAATSSLSDRKM